MEVHCKKSSLQEIRNQKLGDIHMSVFIWMNMYREDLQHGKLNVRFTTGSNQHSPSSSTFLPDIWQHFILLRSLCKYFFSWCYFICLKGNTVQKFDTTIKLSSVCLPSIWRKTMGQLPITLHYFLNITNETSFFTNEWAYTFSKLMKKLNYLLQM